MQVLYFVLLKKIMLQRILDTNSLLRTLDEHVHDQVLCFFGILPELMVVEVRAALADHGQRLISVPAVEGQVTGY